MRSFISQIIKQAEGWSSSVSALVNSWGLAEISKPFTQLVSAKLMQTVKGLDARAKLRAKFYKIRNPYHLSH